MEVSCNNQACYWNGGKFCTKKVVIMRNGVCGALVDKNGNQLPPERWQRPYIDDGNNKDKNGDN